MTLAEFLEESAMSQQRLAEALNVSQGLISHWINNRKEIQPEEALKIAKISGWQVRPHDLRPDIWPNATDALPRKAA
jgi:DNA-binding transcriptional regulator YdaS (Cro superfamily)